MVSQASFAVIFRQQHAGYLRLSTGFNELQSSAVGNSRFSTMNCCTVQAFALGSEAYSTFPLQSQMRRQGKLFITTTRYGEWLGHCFSKSLPYEMYKSYLNTLKFCTHEIEMHSRYADHTTVVLKAGVRSKAIIPSPSSISASE